MFKAEKIAELVRQYGEAFYILDSDKFVQNFHDLNDAFSSVYSNFRLAYSYKTNYIPQICRLVNELGGLAEVVSDMEEEIAEKAGVSPQNIIWNGPIKDIKKVERFLLSGGSVNIDSFEELNSVQKIAHSHPDKTIKIGIRCNFDVGDGVLSRFGMDADGEEFRHAVEVVKGIKNIRLASLHCHFAKRNIEYWPQRARGMCAVVKRVQTMIGYFPERVDIGGGLYGHMHDSLRKQFSGKISDYTEYARATASVFAQEFPKKNFQLVIEPGTALVGDCMQFAGMVKTIKTIRNKTFITILGSQKNINMSGLNPPIEVIETGTDRKNVSDADIVGYTCIEGDVLFRGYSGSISVGDMIIFKNCGSYSVVMKPPFILPDFPIVNVVGNETKLAKRAETFEDIFNVYIF